MAGPRVHRYDVRCPECGSNRMPKDGTSKSRQVCHCGNCGRYQLILKIPPIPALLTTAPSGDTIIN